MTDFIDTHSGILDSSFARIEMSDLMRQRLKESDWIFSGMKTFHELNEAFPSLIREDGSRKPFNQFLNDVQKIDQTYNGRYLRAEYNFANASAEMAAKWEAFEEDGDRYMLQYRTANDGAVRPEHAALHGVTLPAADSFWDTYYPPNGWNCRCTVVQVLRDKYPETDHNEAMRLGREAMTRDTKGMFSFNPGKQGKVFPDYNPYTISKCATCPKALNLAADIPDVDMCAGCDIMHHSASDKTISANRALFERLKADKENYKEVEFNEKSGGVKATSIQHNSGNSKSEKFFKDENGGLTSFQLEKECQDEIFNFGHSCILLDERKRKEGGDYYPALDSMSFGKIMDIRSITAHSESYRNALSAKNAQLIRYNEAFETNENAVCLYFHDPAMYSPNKVYKGYKEQYVQNGIKTDNIIKHVYCVVKGTGIYRFDF